MTFQKKPASRPDRPERLGVDAPLPTVRRACPLKKLSPKHTESENLGKQSSLCFASMLSHGKREALGLFFFFFFFYHFFYFPKLSRWSESISQYPRNPMHFLMTRVCSLNTDMYKTDFFYFILFCPRTSETSLSSLTSVCYC